MAALQLEGHVVLAPDWDSRAANRGADALTASLDQAVALTGSRPEVPLVVVVPDDARAATIGMAAAVESFRRPLANARS